MAPWVGSMGKWHWWRAAALASAGAVVARFTGTILTVDAEATLRMLRRT
jgi:hypothetical protein